MLVSRTIKGIFHETPPQPRYSETWDVATVTKYIESLGENDYLSLAEITLKTVMLLALSRSADLSQLHLKFRRYLPEGVTEAGKTISPDQANVFLPSLPSEQPTRLLSGHMRVGPERPDRKQGRDPYSSPPLDLTTQHRVPQ